MGIGVDIDKSQTDKLGLKCIGGESRGVSSQHEIVTGKGNAGNSILITVIINPERV